MDQSVTGAPIWTELDTRNTVIVVMCPKLSNRPIAVCLEQAGEPDGDGCMHVSIELDADHLRALLNA